VVAASFACCVAAASPTLAAPESPTALAQTREAPRIQQTVFSNQEIVNRMNGAVVYLDGDSTGENTQVDGVRRDSNFPRTTSGWDIEWRGSGTSVVFRNRASDLCMQPKGEPKLQAQIIVKRCDGSQSQRWEVVPEQGSSDQPFMTWSTIRPAVNTRYALMYWHPGNQNWANLELGRAYNTTDRLWGITDRR
jgi:hypothetical protein